MSNRETTNLPRRAIFLSLAFYARHVKSAGYFVSSFREREISLFGNAITVHHSPKERTRITSVLRVTSVFLPFDISFAFISSFFWLVERDGKSTSRYTATKTGVTAEERRREKIERERNDGDVVPRRA